MKEEAYAGDIVIANEDGDKRFILQSDYEANAQKYASKGYEPIAIVVVPATHTDDGTARCMSLKWMSCDSKTGSESYQNIRWGADCNCGTHSAYNSLKYRVHGTTTISVYSSAGSYAASPSNSTFWGTSGNLNVSLDPGAPVVRNAPAVSPYDIDGISKNPDWFVEGGAGDYMDGKENTAAIISKVDTNASSVSETWLTDDSIQNTNEATVTGGSGPATGGNFPAAMCCYRYYTIGTAQKDWYLPALGEIIYLLPRNKEIVDGLILCGIPENITSGTITYSINGRNYIPSSTEYGPSNAYTLTGYVYVNLSSGNTSNDSRTASYNSCVAFIKI